LLEGDSSFSLPAEICKPRIVGGWLRGRKLKTYLKISTAAFVLASLGAGVGAAPAFAQETAEENDRGIQDIVVTATRREESANKVPLAITALGGDTLGDLNITKFDKLIEYLPNVRSASRGPGASSIFIRGLSTDSPGLQIAGTAGAQPTLTSMPLTCSALRSWQGRKARCSARAQWAGPSAISLTSRM
jgi:hypothetical protein